MNHDLKYGLILGIISIVISASIIIIDYSLLASAWWVGFINFGITIAILIYAGYQLRAEMGGTLTFKEGFMSTWLIIVIAGAIATLYSILQYHVLTPELPAQIQEAIINQSASMMERFGADDQTIDEMVAELESDNSFSVNNLLLSFFYTSILGGAVLALIIALIVKKKETADFR
ncbi:DUF4199 domain-containing protein [Porifericola rhodea]|uniref:DUF4199 domain-containing protein n=1 Tax=Porifericola rhodea TaxID=930972 RepID=UPI0026663D51|nr:DUF4199 domain-containing protein [Porifericola rhodea]WKN31821.1 DUF4199 domain-containing protein [Porifericola rhodea]